MPHIDNISYLNDTEVLFFFLMLLSLTFLEDHNYGVCVVLEAEF
jgi:hypothetical protein